MDAFAGPVVVTSALLALAGGLKIVRSAPTSGALRAMRLPSSPHLVRVLGALEVATGVGAGVSFSRPLLVLQAALYLAFAAFVVVALGSDRPLQSCGCFGRADTPPSGVHVILDLLAAVVALAAAVTETPRLTATLSDQPAGAVPFVLLVVVCVYLCVVSLTVLPLTLRSGRVA